MASASPESRITRHKTLQGLRTGNHIKAGLGAQACVWLGFSSLSLKLRTPELSISPPHCPAGLCQPFCSLRANRCWYHGVSKQTAGTHGTRRNFQIPRTHRAGICWEQKGCPGPRRPWQPLDQAAFPGAAPGNARNTLPRQPSRGPAESKLSPSSCTSLGGRTRLLHPSSWVDLTGGLTPLGSCVAANT